MSSSMKSGRRYNQYSTVLVFHLEFIDLENISFDTKIIILDVLVSKICLSIYFRSQIDRHLGNDLILFNPSQPLYIFIVNIIGFLDPENIPPDAKFTFLPALKKQNIATSVFWPPSWQPFWIIHKAS